MDETYQKARGYSFDIFWKDMIPSADVREFLCECLLERFQFSILDMETRPDPDLKFCCERCPCLQRSTCFDRPNDHDNVCLNKLTLNADKVGQRVGQIASIIRNLSFDKVNAEVMSHNYALMR